jgi:hypothetical protein
MVEAMEEEKKKTKKKRTRNRIRNPVFMVVKKGAKKR